MLISLIPSLISFDLKFSSVEIYLFLIIWIYFFLVIFTLKTNFFIRILKSEFNMNWIICLSLFNEFFNFFFINEKVGISFWFVFNENMIIFPLGLSASLHKNSNCLISLNFNKWIVCLIKIKSNFFLFFLKYLIASIFLKIIFLSLSLCLSISMPGYFLISY